MTSNPLVSVITVVYNGRELLRNTIESIRAQTYKNIEYIVIDGNSEDGTQDVIRTNADVIAYWVSEPDEGIYDAMNKGIQASHGDYLWFLNAGDEIFAADTLERSLSTHHDADIYYGETMLIDGRGRELGTRSEIMRNKLPEALTWKDMARGMVVCHQSFIVKRAIVTPYDTQYRFTADIDWVIRYLKDAKVVINTHFILSRFLLGGYSRRNHLRAMEERYRVYRKHFGFFRNLANHALILIGVLGRLVRGEPLR